jgi:hypothetical protein
MSQLLPRVGDRTWDVVTDVEGFSAEGSLERDLEPSELEAFETAAAELPPVVRNVGGVTIRGMATVDDETLWVYVHAVGPGQFDDTALRAAEAVLTHLWSAIHSGAAGQWPE